MKPHLKQYIDSVPNKIILSELTNPSNKYDYLKISSPNECGGKNNPFKFLNLKDETHYMIPNDIYVENLALEQNCNIYVADKSKLQIQKQIKYPLYISMPLNKTVKSSLNSANNCLVILSNEKAAVLYKDHWEVSTGYGAKDNPIYKIVIKNNITIKGRGEIFIQNLVISNKCDVNFIDSQFSVTKSIIVSDNEVQESFEEYYEQQQQQLLGKDLTLAEDL